MKKLFLLLHGRGNTPDGDKSAFFPNMKSDLEKKGYYVLAPYLPYADGWTFEETMEYLNNQISLIQYDSISILGHSGGGYLACHLATKYKVDKLILIAPTCPLPYFPSQLHSLIRSWFDDSGVCHYQTFHHHLFEIDKVIRNTHHIQFFFGSKDPYINREIRQWYAKEFAHAPSLEFHILRNRGHMGVDEGITELPEVINSIL